MTKNEQTEEPRPDKEKLYTLADFKKETGAVMTRIEVSANIVIQKLADLLTVV